MIKLYDRIKEKVYTVGTGNFVLSGPFHSFNSFSSVYSNGNTLFYVATDGARYEIGSGLYIEPSNEIQRFPIKSTNNNQKVNFPEGLKEVYVNYPATNSVFNGSGIDVLPVNSGLAFWTSSNSLSSENSFYIDSGNHRLGINKSSQLSSIDVGGPVHSSNIRASGFIVGLSGIYFPSGNNNNSSYLGGQQLIHYEMNQVDSNTGSNAVIELSGSVNQNILFKKQNAGTFLAGPVSGCSPACEPNYPVFIPIDIDDLPDLSSGYATLSYVDALAFPGPTVSELNQYNGGRLSLSNTDAANVANSPYQNSNIYYVPFTSDLISLWNGSSWQVKQFTSSLVVNSSIYNNVQKIYDVFAYIDTNTGQVAFSTSPWENFNERDSNNINVLFRYDGILCKKNDKFKKYIGSFAIGNLSNEGVFYDSQDKRLLFNAYNQIDKQIDSIVVKAGTVVGQTEWIYSSNQFATILQIPPVEILNGYSYTSYGIPSILKLTTSVIFSESNSIQKGYILSLGISDPNLDDNDIDVNNIINNQYLSIESDYIKMEYNDTVNKKLISNLTNLNNNGWKKYFAMQKCTGTSDTYLVVPNSPINGGPIGGIRGTWRC